MPPVPSSTAHPAAGTVYAPQVGTAMLHAKASTTAAQAARPITPFPFLDAIECTPPSPMRSDPHCPHHRSSSYYMPIWAGTCMVLRRSIRMLNDHHLRLPELARS